jgi:hypothetical protein
VQNTLVQPPKPYSGLDAEFVHQDSSRMLISGQRLSLAAAPVQRGHEVGVETFPERLLRDQLPQLGHELVVTTQMYLGLGPPLGCLQAHLIQPRHVLAQQALTRNV